MLFGSVYKISGRKDRRHLCRFNTALIGVLETVQYL